MKVQRVSGRNPTKKLLATNTANQNAVAGVGARNGTIEMVQEGRTEAWDRAVRPALASALTVVLDREGMVLGVLANHAAARAFLREACL